MYSPSMASGGLVTQSMPLSRLKKRIFRKSHAPQRAGTSSDPPEDVAGPTFTGQLLPERPPSPVVAHSNRSKSPSELWDSAYDSLKTGDPVLVDSYEKLLSRYLVRKPIFQPNSEPLQNHFAQDDKDKRRRQMHEAVVLGLERTGREARARERLGTFVDIILPARNTISFAIQAVPQASLPWAGLCLALEMLANPVKETEACRKGVNRVMQMMDWYWSLSSPLLQESTNDLDRLSQLQQQVEVLITDLYKALLLYQISAVCSFYRNRGLTFLRDLVKLDNWDGSMKDVLDLETRVAESLRGFIALQTSLRLEQLLMGQRTEKDDQCLRDLRPTDSRLDKARIEQTKGGLLVGSYAWILGNERFKQWRDEPQQRLLWIKGDPGKGKTMLLCGVIDELQRTSARQKETSQVAYFFCQANDFRINSATAVLRGLIYFLVEHNPSLLPDVRKKYDHAGKALFTDANSWYALSELLSIMLLDQNLGATYLIVDALDECTTDLPDLLNFVVRTSSSPSHVKWLISSRNEFDIEQALRGIDDQAKLSLELRETATQVADAVDSYIDNKISSIHSLQDSSHLQRHVGDILRKKANGTFLWVSLVIQELESPEVWDPLSVLDEVPSGLHQLYGRMIRKLPEKNKVVCRRILALTTLAYRPLHLGEIGPLLSPPVEGSIKTVRSLVAMCGSFLTIREDQVYLVHQSARDFLVGPETRLFESGVAVAHQDIFLRSMQLLRSVLRRDMHQLRSPGISVLEARALASELSMTQSKYPCLYWAFHLLASALPAGSEDEEAQHTAVHLLDDGIVHNFIKDKFLYWLEALSLYQEVPKAFPTIKLLEELIGPKARSRLAKLLYDAKRFLLSHQSVIEAYPLQVYAAALIFSPARSQIKNLFAHEKPKWIIQCPTLGDKWDARISTLEGHRVPVTEVVFSPTARWLVSGSRDGVIRIWDVVTSLCVKVLKGHSLAILSLSVSNDERRLVSEDVQKHVVVWDLNPSPRQIARLDLSARIQGSIKVSPSSSYIGFLTASGIEIRHLDNLNVNSIIVGSKSEAISFVFTSNDDLAVATEDAVTVYNSFTGDSIGTLKTQNPRALTSTRYAQTLAWMIDGNVQVWNLITCIPMTIPVDKEFHLKGLRLSNSGRNLLVQGKGNMAILWDADTTKSIEQTALNGEDIEDPQVFMAEFRALSDALGQVSHPPALSMIDRLMQISKSQKDRYFCLSSDFLKAASFSPTEVDIQLWDMTLTGMKGDWVRHPLTADRRLLDLSQTGKQFAAPMLGLHQIHVWNVKEQSAQQTPPQLKMEHHEGKMRIDELRFTRTGEHLYLRAPVLLRVWDTTTGDLTIELGMEYSLTTAVFSHDCLQLAAARQCEDSVAIEIWHVRSGKLTASLETGEAPPEVLAFSLNGKLIAAGFEDHLEIWDLSTRQILRDLQIIRPPNSLPLWERSEDAMSFSPDSKQLAMAVSNDRIKIWDVATGHCTHNLCASLDERFTPPLLAFSADGTQLATVHVWTMAVWDLTRAPDQVPSNIEEDGPAPLSIDESTCIHSSLSTWKAFFRKRFLDFNNERACFQIKSRYGVFFLERSPSDSSYRLRRPGYTVSEDGKWIVKDGEKMLWLPPDYRCLGLDDDFAGGGCPSWAEAEGVIVIETRSGRGFLVMRFEQ